jgi:hypothetical protein
MLIAVAGCSGQYRLTVPDQVAPSGGATRTVVRLQRHEFAGIYFGKYDAALRFRIDEAPLRAAFTDERGYATALVPGPAEPGVYDMQVAYQDREGDEAWAQAPAYVLPAEKPVVAVDLDQLPQPGGAGPAASPAAARLCELARANSIVYFTAQPVSQSAWLHSRLLAAGGYPDGPILPWSSHRDADIDTLRKMFRNVSLHSSTR